jgi:hypothetical protein
MVKCLLMRHSDWLKFKPFISKPPKAILLKRMALFFLLPLFLFGWSKVQAQFQTTRSRIQAGLEHFGPSEFKDSSGRFSQSRYSFTFSLPFLKKSQKTENGIRHLQLGFQNQNLLENNRLSLFHNSFFSFQSQLGVNGFWLRNEKNFWVSRISISYFGDAENPDAYFLRPNGNLIYGRSIRQKWKLYAGVSYNFLFGSGFAFPVLGFSYTPNPKTRLTVLLPLSFRFFKFHSRSFYSQVGLRPNGGISVFQSGDFQVDGKRETLMLRNRAFSLFYQLMYMPSSNWRIGLGIGLLSRRKLWISEGGLSGFSNEKNVISETLKNGLQINLNLAYRFGQSLKKESKKDGQVPDLQISEEDLKKINEQDLDLNFDPMDLP